MTRDQRERLRRSFRPPQLRLLFIAEAPPASGRFFYRRDSGLYRAMRDAFQAVDPTIAENTFLTLFQNSGCYLIDLCPEPVDDLPAKSRKRACRNSEATLARAIRRLQPAAIATVVRSIEENVIRCASLARWQGVLLHLPYPGRWARHHDVFVRNLATTIKTLLRATSP